MPRSTDYWRVESDSELMKALSMKRMLWLRTPQIRQQHVDEDPQMKPNFFLNWELSGTKGWLNFGCQQFEAGRHPHPREGYTQGCADHAVPPWLQSRSLRLTLRPEPDGAVKRCRLDEFVEVDKNTEGSD